MDDDVHDVDASEGGSSDDARPARPTGGRLRGEPCQMSPLDMRFSQRKMRHAFADSRLLTESAAAVSVVRNEAAGEDEPAWRLEAPFPAIEVVRWRCKIRDERTGRPKVDQETGLEMYDPDEHWFTLDNRRLYCLQVAAASVYPEPCAVQVLLIPPGPPERMRELRKFRTLDSGRSIMIGSRADGVSFKQWSWEAKVGIDISGDGDTADAAVQGRLKGRRNKAGDLRNVGKAGPQGDRQGQQAGAAQRSPKGALDDGRAEMSKKISWILRHGAKSMGLEIDEEGWIKISDLMELDLFARLPEDAVLEVVNQSNEQKLRYEVKDDGRGGKLLRAAGQKTAQNYNQDGGGHGEGKGKSKGKGKQKGGDGKGRSRGDGKGKGGEYNGDQGWQQGGWQQSGWQQSGVGVVGAGGGGDTKGGASKGKEGKGAEKKGKAQGEAKAKAEPKAKAKAKAKVKAESKESNAESKGEQKAKVEASEGLAISPADRSEPSGDAVRVAQAVHAAHSAGKAYAGSPAAAPVAPVTPAPPTAPTSLPPGPPEPVGASLLAAIGGGGTSAPPPWSPGGGPPGSGVFVPGSAAFVPGPAQPAAGGYPYPPPAGSMPPGSLPPAGPLPPGSLGSGSLPPASLPPGSLPPGSLPPFGAASSFPPYSGAYGDPQAHYMQAMQQMQQVQAMQQMHHMQAMQAMAWAQNAGMGLPPPQPGGYPGGAGAPDAARRSRKAKQQKPQ